MCGIAGLLYYDRREGDVAAVARMTDAMRSRGPDDEGFALFDAVAGAPRLFGGRDTPEDVFHSPHAYCPRDHIEGALLTANLALGHRRLSILDLSPAGHQPMCSKDGRYWLVYNGEIYNFMEIREQLKARGAQFETRCDSEVLLQAYVMDGPGFLERLNGMFAFAIFDRQQRTLFCARDRIGIKPFHYHAGDGYFLFASELPALFDAGLHKAAVNPNGLYHGMSWLIAPRPMTAFQGVVALAPGHWMTVSSEGEVRRERYWAPPAAIEHGRSAESLVEELDELVDKAVQRRLIADVEVGTFMSGGVDSTLISSLAAKHQPGIKAFTLSHDLDAGLDELPQARAVAAMWPMTHVVRETTDDYTLAFQPEMARVYMEPFSSVSPNFVISKLAADSGVICVLNGTGPDEVFAGYSRFDSLARWRRLQPFAGVLGLLPALGPLASLQDLAGRQSVAEHYLHTFGLFQTSQKQALFQPEFLTQVEEPDSARLLERLYLEEGEFEDDIHAACMIELMHYVGNHFTNRMDPIMMHFSLEGRFPFLDHEVVEFGMRLPSEFKIRQGDRKWVLRQVAAKYIDPSCLAMKKKGFTLPIVKWIEGPLKQFVHQKLTDLADDGTIFRPDEVLAIRDGRDSHRLAPRQIWYLVSTQLWREAFFTG